MARPKLSFQEMAEQHGESPDPQDPLHRSRFRRMLDKMYERGLSELNTSQKAAEEYCARVAGKPVTPVNVSGVTTETPEERLAAIRECLFILSKGKDADCNPQRVN